MIQLLNIGDVAWWENLDGLVGLAWGIQSFAKPKQQQVPNPPIAAADMQDLRNAWLKRRQSGHCHLHFPPRKDPSKFKIVNLVSEQLPSLIVPTEGGVR